MDVQFASSKYGEKQAASSDLVLKNRRLGLLIWRISNGLIFVFFIFANFLMRSVQTNWPPEGTARPDMLVPTLVTILLILSSIPASRALNAIRQGNQTELSRNVLVVLGAGTLFIVGVIYSMVRLPYSGPYSSIINAMNGFHILHAFVGMMLFAYVLRQAAGYTKDNHWTVEAATVFWHFVDLMWVFFFIVMYLI